MKSLNAIIKRRIIDSFEFENVKHGDFVFYKKSMKLSRLLEISIELDKNETLKILSKSIEEFENQNIPSK